jgi:hypothetical protein
MTDINLGTVPLGDHDADWFKVMCRLSNRSLRANAASVLGYYIRRRKSEYVEILSYTARKYGLTVDEAFKRLLNDESLGEPIANFSEAPPLLIDD